MQKPKLQTLANDKMDDDDENNEFKSDASEIVMQHTQIPQTIYNIQSYNAFNCAALLDCSIKGANSIGAQPRERKGCWTS